MAIAQNASTNFSSGVAGRNESTVFGVPIGKLGLLSRLAMAGACGFLVFFVTFFFAIIGVAMYDMAAGKSLVNLNIAYLYIAAPVGILALLISLIYLVGGWARHKISSAE
jgi:hypothetical protein